MRLLRVRVATDDGETAAAVDVRRESRIEVTYDVLPPMVDPDELRRHRRALRILVVVLIPLAIWTLVGLIVFMLGPLVFAIILGFSSWDGFGSRSFVGFDNFIGVLQDQQLRQSWINTAWFTVLQLPGLLDQLQRGDDAFHLHEARAFHQHSCIRIAAQLLVQCCQ